MELQKDRFAYIAGVEEMIYNQQRKMPNRQQLWVLLLADPERTQLCLYLPVAAVRDNCHNWCPPQGRIGRRETLSKAVCTQMQDRFSIRIQKLEYLGSCLRQFDETHPRASECNDAFYHWMFASAVGYSLLNPDWIADIRWHHNNAEPHKWVPINMRPEKRHMFIEALKIAAMGPLVTVPSWSKRIFAAEAAAHG